MRRVLLDTGFWRGRVSQGDRHEARAREIARSIDDARAATIIVWPILYEIMRTKFMKNPRELVVFQQAIGNSRVEYVDDAEYRQGALVLAFNSAARGRPLSLVDCVLRLILEDADVRIDTFVTFDPGDFDDVCNKRGVDRLS